MSDLSEAKAVELIGPALDWATAKACGIPAGIFSGTIYRSDRRGDTYGPGPAWNPSKNWGDGGPLIDEYKPWLSPPVGNDQDDEPYGWDAEIYSADGFEQLSHIVGAPTALIAVCRAIVAANLGETVLVPVELMK